jgi:serralysin
MNSINRWSFAGGLETLGLHDGRPVGGGIEGVGDGSAGLSATKPAWTLEEIVVNYLRTGHSWPAGATVYYSFRESTPPGTSEAFVALTATERAMARMAFDLIEDVVNLTFVELPDDGKATDQSNRIYFGASSSIDDHWGHAQRWTAGGTIAAAEVWISTAAVAARQWFPGGYNFQALMHEIVHTLGITHPGPYDGSDDDPVTFADDATYAQDTRQYTIMSYFDGELSGADYTADFADGRFSPSTPMLHDLAGLQKLYGPNTGTRSGDTTYGYNDTTGRISYDFSAVRPDGSPAPKIFTIWDGGGVDTIDFSGTSFTVNLDLRPGMFSDAFEMVNNIAIGFGVTIENAIGGSAADVLRGNDAGNRLEGRLGNDVLTGGLGDDMLDGGVGGDQLDGGAGFDFASYRTALAGVTVFFGDPGLNTGDASADSYVSIEGLVGSGFADLMGGDDAGNVLYGESGNDWLFGGGGADGLVGGAGHDLLEGGLGGDWLDGGDGLDAASYRNATAGVVADLRNPAASAGEAAGDGYGSIENVWGSDFADVIVGHDTGGQVYGFYGDDYLFGYGGDDNLYGGAGVDFLLGGAGADTFFFLQAAEGSDQLNDFVSGADRLFVSQYWFGLAIQAPGRLADGQFVSGTAPSATGTGPQFLWDSDDHRFYYDEDGAGAAGPVLLASFAPGTALTAADIWSA